jgi:hypothetical protein
MQPSELERYTRAIYLGLVKLDPALDSRLSALLDEVVDAVLSGDLMPENLVTSLVSRLHLEPDFIDKLRESSEAAEVILRAARFERPSCSCTTS